MSLFLSGAMSKQSNQLSFELLLEGTRDQKTLTVRRIRSILMEELELQMEEAQSLLETTPVAIHRAPNIDLLRPLLDRLSRSGARAQIIRHTQAAQHTPTPKDNQPVAALKARTLPAPLKLSEVQSGHQTQSAAKTPRSPIEGKDSTLKQNLTHSKKNPTPKRANKPHDSVYRTQVVTLDRQFRLYLKREFALSPTLLTLLALLSCALFIQVGIYVDTVQYKRYQKSVRLLENYLSIAVLGGNEGYLDPALAKQLRR